jgi:(p)ppGpp synthase/HD superfamily hydrolase
MNIIEKSLKIALKAHSGQLDKAGRPYILHPIRVMNHMDTDEERAVALLHDVLEDSKYTEEDLLQQGIPEVVVNAVIALTKKMNESYEGFIERVLNNKLAVKIKKADLMDNMDLLRIKSIETKDLERVEKYHEAYKFLSKSH